MDEYLELLFNIKYYDHESVMKEMKKIVYEELCDVLEYSSNTEGLCKLVCNNIKCRLDEINLKSKIINTGDFNKPEHEFIIVTFKDTREKVNYVLIDATYRQFIKRNGKLLHYNEWPAALLKTSNEELLNDLISCGCSIINSNSFKDYLNSFEIDSSLEDVMLERYKEETYETNIKK